MKNIEKDQVDLDQLIFTLNWEDPQSDRQALQIEPGDTVMSITSGGCNTIEFLLDDPAIIYSVDINPAQSYLMDLKINAIKHLSYEDFSLLMGLKNSDNRIGIYEKIRSNLTPKAQTFWDEQRSVLKDGLIMQGRYEKFVNIAGSLIRGIQGRKIIENVFKSATVDEQARYFESTFNTRRFRFIFPLLFNKWMLAKRGLDADYFHFDDGSQSFAESFYNRTKKVLKDIPVRGNYFLSLYLTGSYQNGEEVPNYFKEEHFDTLKARVNRIQIITRDAKQWLQAKPDNSIDCFSLSNICELKSEADTASLFHEVARVGSDQSRVCFRNLMVPRKIPRELHHIIRKRRTLSSELLAGDRSFVYGKVDAYLISKG